MVLVWPESYFGSDPKQWLPTTLFDVGVCPCSFNSPMELLDLGVRLSKQKLVLIIKESKSCSIDHRWVPDAYQNFPFFSVLTWHS